MNCTSTLCENRLRQKIIMLEDSLARVSSTRKDLRDNIDLVKNEVRSAFGSQLNRLRTREQQILEKVDTVSNVKDGILCTQQDQLHLALGACSQGMQWLQTAYDDLKTNKLNTMESVERRIGDILNNFSSLDCMPRETSYVSFDFDAAAMRRSVASFGQIRAMNRVKNSGSLPCALEDYDEDRHHDHSMSHKSVHSSKPVNMFPVNHQLPCNDGKEWLLKEALTSSTLSPNETSGMAGLTRNSNHMSNEYLPHQQRPKSRHHNQIHNWLHQIKNTTENEPTVFEDFDIKKAKKNTMENIPVDIADEEAGFRKFFQQIVLSPNQQWLMDKKLSVHNTSPSESKYTIDTNDEISSCHSSFTHDGTGQFVFINSELFSNGMGMYEQCQEYWSKFLHDLWTSADSMWLTSCSSADQPTMLEMTFCDDDEKTMNECDEWVVENGEDPVEPPKNFRSPANSINWVLKMPHEQMAGLKIDNTFPTALDHDIWLHKPVVSEVSGSKPVAGSKFLESSTLGGQRPPPINERAPSVADFEEALGWCAILERLHGMGDEHWLAKPVAPKVMGAEMVKMECHEELLYNVVHIN